MCAVGFRLDELSSRARRCIDCSADVLLRASSQEGEEEEEEERRQSTMYTVSVPEYFSRAAKSLRRLKVTFLLAARVVVVRQVHCRETFDACNPFVVVFAESRSIVLCCVA